MKHHYLCTLTLLVLSLILPLIHSLLFVLGLRFESIFHRLQFCGGLFEVVLIPQNFRVPFLFVCGNCSANNVCVNSSFLADIKITIYSQLLSQRPSTRTVSQSLNSSIHSCSISDPLLLMKVRFGFNLLSGHEAVATRGAVF